MAQAYSTFGRVLLAIIATLIIVIVSFGISISTGDVVVIVNPSPNVHSDHEQQTKVSSSFKDSGKKYQDDLIIQKSTYNMSRESAAALEGDSDEDLSVNPYVIRTGVNGNSTDIDKLIKQYYPWVIRRLAKPRLPNYKNPCFLEKDRTGATVTRCLPYFYLIGAPKCGTTDFWWNIVRHPNVVHRVKEGNWWTRSKKNDRSITQYLKKHDGFVKKISHSTVPEAQLIVGDGSASTLWDNSLILEDTDTKRAGEIPFVCADVIHRVQPDAKIIAILREPVDRTISAYFAFGRKQSPDDFHKRAETEINRFNKCLEKRSLRTCANLEYYPQIQVSVYIAHVTEWLRVYGDQVLILRTEDWHNHTQLHLLRQVFNFLEIEPVSERKLNSLTYEKKRIKKKQETKLGERKHGKILSKTKKLLHGFFEPYNKQLADLLQDEKFAWKDVIRKWKY